jgi:hypothetical protein
MNLEVAGHNQIFLKWSRMRNVNDSRQVTMKNVTPLPLRIEGSERACSLVARALIQALLLSDNGNARTKFQTLEAPTLR